MNRSSLPRPMWAWLWVFSWGVAGPAFADTAPSASAAVAQTRPPAFDFVRPPLLHTVRISPSGRHVALLMTGSSGRRVLAVRALADGAETRTVAAYRDGDINRVFWVNDRRLVYEVVQPRVRVEAYGAGTFAVDIDGGEPRRLTTLVYEPAGVGSQLHREGMPYGWFVATARGDDSDEVMAYSLSLEEATLGNLEEVVWVDTRSGRVRRAATGLPPHGRVWLTDLQREVRVMQTVHQGRSRLHWRAPGSTEWKVVHDEPLLDQGVLQPVNLESEHTLIVEGRNGRDNSALYTFDLRTGRLDPEPLVALAGYDLQVDTQTDHRTRQLVGVHTVASRPVSVWFDDGMADIQAAVDQARPGRFNSLMCSRCTGAEHFIVYSAADDRAGEYLHYDHRRRELRPLGQLRPWLPPQGRRSFHRVPARDGLVLPVVVTHPPGVAPDAQPARPLPTVLWVHGGPWVRGGDLRWDAEAQFLASRGYRVLEVEYRGSTGLGWRHFQAGWKQWGTGMQDDLADALAWATKAGLSDAGRVCIGGTSYGGYAALMSMVRHPGLYRCGISFAGLTDIQLMYDTPRSDTSEESKRFSLPVLVGDPKADAELLRAASPLARVAEIRGPVLVAWGQLDARVPPEHAERFVRAARSAGVPVEMLRYQEVAHGFLDPLKHADFLEQVETFLQRHLLAPATVR
jgi:dipeptidyl aminopeptidase/acylaminoacyl peptidase